jgi:hypothetical protein
MTEMEIESVNWTEYKIALNVQTFQDMVESAETKFFRNKKNELQIRSKKLRGNWVKSFQKVINDYEKDDLKMLGKFLIILNEKLFLISLTLGKAARINEEKKRESAPYFKASAKCNEKKCQWEYTFTNLTKPVTAGQGFVEIVIRRTYEHKHVEGKVKIN